MRKFFLLLLLLGFCAPAAAEIETATEPCKDTVCLYWWPKLPPVEGWHHEREFSVMNRANAQAPDGFTFANAASVIYARALRKAEMPAIPSLEALIKDDRRQFLSGDPGLKISQTKPLTTGDGQVLQSYTFFPKGKGNWEQASYGNEDEYYLIFVVSARTQAGFTKALEAYKKFIARYKKKL